MSRDEGYLLDNRQAQAGERFSAMARLFDPVTFRHVDRLGIGRGARVWEVGAGGPTVPEGLARRVGPQGYVLATDLDTSWLPDDAPYEVRRHDVATDPPPPEAPFDLVHARLVLLHVPARATALAGLVRALRPGGYLLLEDADPALQPLACPDEHGRAQRLANQVRRGFRTLMADQAADLAYGRTLPRLLRAAGLEEVGAEVFFPLGGRVCAELERATVEQVRNRLLMTGLASPADLYEHLANVDAGLLDLAPAPLVSAWGRRP
jgi:SAM-dependent methyltransferase